MKRTPKPRGKHTTTAQREALARFHACKKFDIRYWSALMQSSTTAIRFLLKKKLTEQTVGLIGHNQDLFNVAEERLRLAKQGVLLPIPDKPRRVDRADTITVMIRGSEKVLPAY